MHLWPISRRSCSGSKYVFLAGLCAILVIIIFMFIGSINNVYGQAAQAAAVVKTVKKKLLFAFLTIGPKPERNEAVRLNLNYVLEFKRNSSDRYDVECVIYSRVSRPQTPDFARFPTDCHTVYLPGGTYTHHLYHMDPTFLKQAGYDYITLSLDDVLLFPPFGNIDLRAYMDTVVSTNLSMSSPVVPGSPHPWMQAREMKNGTVGHTVPFVEIQFTTFSMDAWACIYGLFDLELAFYWFDVFFHEYCFSRNRGVAGVLDGFTALHNVTQSTYTQTMDHGQFLSKWKELHNETLVSNWHSTWTYELIDRNGTKSEF